ncbi:hypothetical protein CEXT_311181 [Caerostris extrusa]|uniref:Uncharacterized protein n=1 Tax=Caerostris extrusa TaxID=172846 RepID=A0AAV4SSH4_CAEEX|nr:hypothetical protein CEXT_311181 [Caerostris extrusa]
MLQPISVSCIDSSNRFWKPCLVFFSQTSKVEEKLLPSPYETRCQDYKSAWRMRGGRGPLNQEMCVAECAYNISVQQCDCVMPGIIYHHDRRICNNGEVRFLRNRSHLK